jgi:predicted O-linked N-acetylglucosamine transferase (SPINDLY family)
MRGRLASGILREAGLGEWVANTHEADVEKAERLCADRSLRDRVRAQMKERRASLFDDRETVAALADCMAKYA